MDDGYAQPEDEGDDELPQLDNELETDDVAAVLHFALRKYGYGNVWADDYLAILDGPKLVAVVTREEIRLNARRAARTLLDALLH